MGGAGSDQAAGIAVDGWGNVYTTGLYGGYVSGVSNYTADFDPGAGVYDLSAAGGIFVSKLIPTGSGLRGSTSAASPEIGAFTESAATVASGSSLTLTALNISDGTSGVAITAVTFYALDSSGNRYTLGTGTQNSDGAWSLTFTVNLAPGTYTLFAQAQDSNGLLSDPLALTLQVA